MKPAVQPQKDSSGNNYDGTLISGGSGLPVWRPTSGQINGAIDVNNQSHINCGQILDINDNFTIALWFKARKWGQTTGTYNFPGLLSKRNLYDGNCEWELFHSPGGGGAAGTKGLQFWFNNKGNQKIFSSAGIDPTLNTWHHVAVTRSGDYWALYLDGICEATQTNTVGIIGTGSDVRIGVLGGDALSQCFEGLIDDVRGYPRALSQSEINDIMNGG